MILKNEKHDILDDKWITLESMLQDKFVSIIIFFPFDYTVVFLYRLIKLLCQNYYEVESHWEPWLQSNVKKKKKNVILTEVYSLYFFFKSLFCDRPYTQPSWRIAKHAGCSSFILPASGCFDNKYFM